MANGSWIAIAMTPGGDVAARTKPSPKRIGSHRGIVLLLHRAIPITMMATSPPARYATSSILATAEVFPERRTCAAAAAVVWAVAAAAKLNPTSTLANAPQKAADPPITAAVIANEALRRSANVEIAANDTANAPSPKMTSRLDTYSCVECAAAIGNAFKIAFSVVVGLSSPCGVNTSPTIRRPAARGKNTASTTVPPRLGYDSAMSWVGSSRFAATTVTAPPFLGQGCHDQRQAVGGHRQDQILD